MRYDAPGALRTALEDRLRVRAEETGTSLARLRRRVVFERLLVRLEHATPGRWILKGGMALELRFRDRARSTKDIDLALRDPDDDGDVVRDLLIEALLADPEGDGFEFAVGTPLHLHDDEAGRPGWRFHVDASLAGRRFDALRVDVVARPEEITGTERLALPGLLAFADLPPHDVEVVNRDQHFAEKLHALTRTYGDLPSSRTKDLVDLVLLVEDGLDPSPDLLRAVSHVFAERRTHAIPAEPPRPPAAWKERYARSAEELGLLTPDLDSAMLLVQTFWWRTLEHGE
jgi:predicted nucleotidyltransferase component of viral defense system